MSEEMNFAEQRKKALFLEKKNGYDVMDPALIPELNAYCEDYKAFLTVSKTEREAVKETIAQAEARGFKPFVRGMELKSGDKVYFNNRGKAIFLAVIGEQTLDHGVNICAAHIDSPRLDIKPYPLYEEGEFAMMKTHYYGGIRKYQWLSIPLELHGVVVRQDGSSVDVCIGGEPGDPYLVIPDLLPHLSSKQAGKPIATAVDPEKLNIMVGSRPYADESVSDRLKLMVLDILNEKYGITEEDFLSAELCAVPAYDAVDIGLDRSMIGGYGQDDRVCSYASLRALFDAKKLNKTGICLLVDKEEIGSMGVTGMQSEAFECFVADLCAAQGVEMRVCFENSFCLSADVPVCYDPNYADVYDKNNSSLINRGIGLSKYTGSRGKSGASDASAEVMGYVRRILTDEGVVWHVSELGKTDVGGGGTVALHMANRNINTLDAGVSVLGMHSPMEVTSKFDCYMAYRAMRAIFEA